LAILIIFIGHVKLRINGNFFLFGLDSPNTIFVFFN